MALNNVPTHTTYHGSKCPYCGSQNVMVEHYSQGDDEITCWACSRLIRLVPKKPKGGPDVPK